MDSTTVKLLDDLRQAERFWRIARWAYLFTSVVPIAGNIWAMWKYHDIIQFMDELFAEKSLELVFYLTIAISAALISASFGGFGLAYVIQNWRGNRTRQMVISITERDLEGR